MTNKKFNKLTGFKLSQFNNYSKIKNFDTGIKIEIFPKICGYTQFGKPQRVRKIKISRF